MAAKLPAHAIDHRGVVCSLYEQLWKVHGPPLFTSESGTCLRIPHTVVYRQSAPCGWYFTTKSYHVARRKRSRLCNDEIISVFASRDAGPAAIWRQQSRDKAGNLAYSESILSSGDLEAFLRSDQVTDGVLQVFVKPGGQHMRFFRATWTRHICYIELVEKEAQMSEKRASLRRRVCFFNARDVTCKLVRNASYIGRLIEFACDSIVQKLQAQNRGALAE